MFAILKTLCSVWPLALQQAGKNLHLSIFSYIDQNSICGDLKVAVC